MKIRNPKLAPIIWLPVLLLAMAGGFYMMDSPRRSLEASREWMNQHQEEWRKIKNVNPALKHVELSISTEGRGTVLASGYTYDQNAVTAVGKFVDANEPPNLLFKDRIKLLSRAEFDEWEAAFDNLGD
jgi:hypothetical protein